jgi:hypothetical protein
MYVLMIPQGKLLSWAGLGKGGGGKIFCLEGTGHVSTDFYENEGVKEVAVRVPDTLDTLAFPGVENSFYKKNVHLYTNTLFRAGMNVGHFTFFKDGKYGVPFADVLKDRGVSLLAHEGFDAETMADIRAIMTHERPSPPLRVPPKTVGAKRPFQGHTCKDKSTLVGLRYKDFFADKGDLNSEERGAIGAFIEGRDVRHVEDIHEDFTVGHSARRVRVSYA